MGGLRIPFSVKCVTAKSRHVIFLDHACALSSLNLYSMSEKQVAARVPLRKRKKVSGLTKIELTQVLIALTSLKTSLKEVSATDADLEWQGNSAAFGSEFEETLDKFLEMMRLKVEGPRVCLTAPCSQT